MLSFLATLFHTRAAKYTVQVAPFNSAGHAESCHEDMLSACLYAFKVMGQGTEVDVYVTRNGRTVWANGHSCF